jgi:hypothetical protein
MKVNYYMRHTQNMLITKIPKSTKTTESKISKSDL